MYFSSPVQADADVPFAQQTLQEKIGVLAEKYDVSPTLAAKIIWCESTNRPLIKHKNTDGSIDRSYWEINDYWWEPEWVQRRGLPNYDITDPDQNLEAGFAMMSIAGTTPWLASKPCWSDRNLTVDDNNVITIKKG